MASVTRPPPKIRLSPKDVACHRLARLLIRAFYDRGYVAIYDCLLDLQARQGNKVSESDLSSALHMNPKVVREALYALRNDWLVKGVQKSEAPKATEELTSKGKRKGYTTRAPTASFTWYVDFELLAKVLKYRHHEMLSKLNTKVDKSEVYYICPTLECENHQLSHKKNVMDLLMESAVNGKIDSDFRCDKCFTTNTLLNTRVATPLILLTQFELGITDSANRNADPTELLKTRLNDQLQEILIQMKQVDELLAAEFEAKKAMAEAGAAAALAAQSGNVGVGASSGGTLIGSLGTIHAPAPGASSSSASSSASLLPPASTDEIRVDLSEGGGMPVPDAKRIKIKLEGTTTTKSNVSPWDAQFATTATRVDEAAKQLKAEMEAKEEEEQRQRELEQQESQAKYTQLLQQHAAASAVPAAASDALSSAAAMDVEVLVAGQPMLLSQITQVELDLMTPEEFDHYSSLAGDDEYE